MGVILELSLPSSEFELGRILEVEGDASVNLETLVPVGGRSVPFFRVRDSRTAFEELTREHSAVTDLQVVSTHDGETLYALDWDPSDDAFFRILTDLDAYILNATGEATVWAFELRMPTHDALSEFQELCFDANIPIDVRRIYNPTSPDAGPWYGLSAIQRKTLQRAVEEGYYAIPRGTSTEALAEEFDISDQAVTERLRRAIATLTKNTLLLTQEADDSDWQ